MAEAMRQHRLDSCNESTPLTINAFPGTSTEPRYSSVISSEYVPLQQEDDIPQVRDDELSSHTCNLYGHEEDDQTRSARNRIISALRVFPSALGLLVCISCNIVNVPRQMPKAMTHLGPRVMEEAFKFLGYATCTFHNPTSELIADICVMLANDIDFHSTNVRRLFLYICAHGSGDCLRTTNGGVSISDIIKKFMSFSTDLKIPRIFLCDACRGEIDGDVDPLLILPIPLFYQQNPDEIFGNTLTFFSTSKLFKAYTFPEGAPVIAEILRDLLMRHEHRNLLSVLTIDVKVELEKRAKKYPELKHVYPDCRTYLSEEIDLYGERLTAMTPTEVTIIKGFFKSEISWIPPIHAKEQELQSYNVIIRDSNMNQKEYIVDDKKTIIKVPTRCLRNAMVTVEANYPDDRNVSAEPKPSNVKRNRTAFLLLGCVTFIVCAIMLALFVASLVLVSSTKEDITILGVTGDVIECAGPNWRRTISDIHIEEVAEGKHDNSEGFPMDIFELSHDTIENNLRTSDPKVYLKQTKRFDVDGSQQFVIPFGSYNLPLYLWQGSTIVISYLFMYSRKPTEGVLYLVKGDKEIDNFVSSTQFHHEQSFNLLKYNYGQFQWDISDSGYYFLGVSTNITSGTVTEFNVTYIYKYIDQKDFSSWIKESARSIDGVGQTATLTHSVSSRNTNHTLCYLNYLDSDDTKIHLNVSFEPKFVTWFLPPFFIAAILASYFFFFFLLCVYLNMFLD